MPKKGFTLAEVLITLAIIGVVAALTIPAVVKNYQQTQLKAQFKKAYSTVQNAYQKTQLDMGIDLYVLGSDNSNSYRSQFFAEFAKNLKVVKKCTKAYSQGCSPEYKGVNTVYGENYPEIDPDSRNYYGNFREANIKNVEAWVLADGSIILINQVTIAVDVNGMKKPNKWGHDLFPLALTRGGYIPGQDTTIVEKGGKLGSDLLKN